MSDKPPFIDSQEMFLLHDDTENPRRFLSPDVFRETRMSGKHDEEQSLSDESP